MRPDPELVKVFRVPLYHRVEESCPSARPKEGPRSPSPRARGPDGESRKTHPPDAPRDTTTDPRGCPRELLELLG